MWLSEVTLWTQWLHCGELVSKADCVLMRIEAEAFEKTLKDRAENCQWFRYLRKYAALFAQRISDSLDTDRPMTDVDRNWNQAIESMVERAFPPEIMRRDDKSSASTLSMGELVKDLNPASMKNWFQNKFRGGSRTGSTSSCA
mmetsp:Transcript_112339/g.176808  ORF Transcript_112339/g.176808 Transcript_112339/m.176808 type:complete len:143 (-) Transcript_112339:134-562(-)